MTENERNLHSRIEAKLKDIDRALRECLDNAKSCYAASRQSREGFESIFAWRPFPAEKPPNYGEYLTTCEYKNGSRYVERLYWNGDCFRVVAGNAFGSFPSGDGMNKFVTAWMPVPMPYERRV